MGKRCGVYKYVYNGEIIYVGKSDSSIDNRIKGHSHESKFEPFLKKCDIYYAWLPNPAFTTIFETFLINKYKPRLNSSMKYDKILPFDIIEPIWYKYDKAKGCIYNNGDEDRYSNPVDMIKNEYHKRMRDLEKIIEQRKKLCLPCDREKISRELITDVSERSISSGYFGLWQNQIDKTGELLLSISEKDKTIDTLKKQISRLNQMLNTKTIAFESLSESCSKAIEMVKEKEQEIAYLKTNKTNNLPQKSFKSKIKAMFSFA